VSTASRRHSVGAPSPAPAAFMEGSHFRLRVASLARRPFPGLGQLDRTDHQAPLQPRYGVPVTSASWAPPLQALRIRSRVPSGCVRGSRASLLLPPHWRQVVSQDRGGGSCSPTTGTSSHPPPAWRKRGSARAAILQSPTYNSPRRPRPSRTG